MALLAVSHIYKSYEGAPLLIDVSFDIAEGEIVCLLGPSGTGKTTLLRIIAGLEDFESGQILYDGRDIAEVPVYRRGFGLMFQDLALFPHRRVYDNVAFGLRMQGAAASDIPVRVNEMLTLVGLDPARFAARDVNQLSGGEQQRVALARTLAPRPRLVMFDEPLGALDRLLREQLVLDLRVLLKHLGMTALYVTHDQEEAFAIADRMVLLNAGRVEQIGVQEEMYRHPANAFVARFLGLTNLLPGRVVERLEDRVRVETTAGLLALRADDATVGQTGFVLLRPRAVRAVVNGSNATENILRGRISQVQLRGGHTHIVFETAELVLNFEWDAPVNVGAEAVLELDPKQFSWLLH